MPTTVTANRTATTDDVVSKLAMRAYLAGLGTAAALVLGATVLASLGLDLAFG